MFFDDYIGSAQVLIPFFDIEAQLKEDINGVIGHH